MKFGLMIDLGRTSPDTTMEDTIHHVTEITKTAEAVGFDSVFVGEHHGHEMTIAPAPFTLLTHLAGVTERIRLGTAVLCAPYWHPIRLAGEASLFDHLSEGRLELGIGRGAYPYEFARMANGIPPEVAREQLGELLPALRGLWAGNYTHDGSVWKFPSTTSTPRPLSEEGIPLWVSARHPDVFKMAVENRANVMVAPLSKGFDEVESLREKLDTATAEVDNGFAPQFAVLRTTYVAGEDEDPMVPVRAFHEDSGWFQNLFNTEGNVDQGWVKYVDPDSSDTLENIARNNMFGTADEVTERMHEYDEVGTDLYIYNAGFGMPLQDEIASIRRFGDKVIPQYQDKL